MKNKEGFTLAEVLITLAIIGVVAAMTIPTLIAKINDIVTTNQAKVFNAKLIKGLNLTKTTGDLNDTYNSTYEFLTDGLGKNLKMAKVCDSDHIRDCIPYDKIKFDKKDGSEDTINVKDIKTASKLNLKAPFTDVAAFVLADGTPVIASYNLQCIDDPDKADTSINACFAGVYDLNGTRKPNKFGVKVVDETTSYTNDLRAFNGAAIGNSSVCLESGGNKVCIAKTAIKSREITWQNYFDEMPQAPAPWNSEVMFDDYWAVSEKYCEAEGGHLPTPTELTTIARVLYGDTSISDAVHTVKYDLTMVNKSAVYTALGIDENMSSFVLVSDESTDPAVVTGRSFEDSYTSTANDYGRSEDNLIICTE